MNPFGHKQQADVVSARALVLTPPVGPGAAGAVATTLAIELPDQRVVVGNPTWYYRDYAGVLGVGRWVPVKLPADEPDEAELDKEHVPYDSDVAEVVAEALGGDPVSPVSPDEWRIRLALQFAEQLISAGGLTAAQADAIRVRIKQGV